jgi:hypothetical protein
MTDEHTNPEHTTSSADSWQEVGKQFQAMGEGLASVFHSAWEKEENKQRLKDMENGLEGIVQNISQVLKETAATPEAQQLKQEVKKVGESLSQAGEQTAQEGRPPLLAALKQANEEIQKLVERMDL